MGELQALSQQAETLCCASSFPYVDPQYLAMHIAAPAAAWKLHATPVAQALSHYCKQATPATPQRRPLRLGILRPDAKGLAGTAKDLRNC